MKYAQVTIFIGGLLLIAVVGKDRILRPAQNRTQAVAISEAQHRIDETWERLLNDPRTPLGLRVESTAAKTKFDVLVHFDSMSGSHESITFFDEEVARIGRIDDALKRVGQPGDLEQITPLSKSQHQIDEIWERLMHDNGGSSYQRAESAASKIIYDSLVRFDARLGTHESATFLDEELARAERILNIMQKARASYLR